MPSHSGAKSTSSIVTADTVELVGSSSTPQPPSPSAAPTAPIAPKRIICRMHFLLEDAHPARTPAIARDRRASLSSQCERGTLDHEVLVRGLTSLLDRDHLRLAGIDVGGQIADR